MCTNGLLMCTNGVLKCNNGVLMCTNGVLMCTNVYSFENTNKPLASYGKYLD